MRLRTISLVPAGRVPVATADSATLTLARLSRSDLVALEALFMTMSRILVPTDFSDDAEAALDTRSAWRRRLVRLCICCTSSTTRSLPVSGRRGCTQRNSPACKPLWSAMRSNAYNEQCRPLPPASRAKFASGIRRVRSWMSHANEASI